MTPLSTRPVNLGQRTPSSIWILARSSAAPDDGTVHSGISNGMSRRAARSRATPATDIASGRLGLISRSHKMSPTSPNSCINGAPVSRCSGRIMMPSWSEPKPSSAAEQHMPLDISPRISLCEISIPSGMTVPMVANGIRSPTDMLNAPQQTCIGSPFSISTSTSWILSAFG